MQLINYLPILAVLSPALGLPAPAPAPALAAAPLPAPATISKNPNIAPMCTPQLNANTCVLNWNTNTMAANDDLSNINNLVAYARVTIYSNTCTAIGGISNGLDQNVYVDAAGFEQRMLLQNMWDEAKGFKVPRWIYDGKQYGVENCSCFDGPLLGEPKDTHVCQFPFDCHS
ncbi:hypothetical protein SBOR_1687 [Sclerotinia borealis F-4128]|uniref:Uncharacterized protein n=1 Tax=Sclerotinia borealis (strain F-4128) TaxID=1432307 RepID=W9CMB4_SCLBF|nr:hypothetical protein SBOR_1687 [Sclerotinia borealis F-4128]